MRIGGMRQNHVWIMRRHDVHPVSTRIALSGLLIGILIAILGLPPLDLHGPLHDLGVMDPLCGGTRSVYLTLHGQLPEAVRYNPAGPPIVAGSFAVVIRAALGWLTSYWVDVQVPRKILLAVFGLMLVVLEVNQQLHAGLLMQPWVSI